MWPDISISVSWGFPGHTAVKNPPTNDRDLGSIPELGRCLGEGNGNPLQYSCLENPTDREAWWGPQSMGSQRVRHGWETGQAHIKACSLSWPAAELHGSWLTGQDWYAFSSRFATLSFFQSWFIIAWHIIAKDLILESIMVIPWSHAVLEIPLLSLCVLMEGTLSPEVTQRWVKKIGCL